MSWSVEFNEQEHDLDSDANEDLEIKTCYILSCPIIKQHNKEIIPFEVPLHKYLGVLTM